MLCEGNFKFVNVYCAFEHLYCRKCGTFGLGRIPAAGGSHLALGVCVGKTKIQKYAKSIVNKCFVEILQLKSLFSLKNNIFCLDFWWHWIFDFFSRCHLGAGAGSGDWTTGPSIGLFTISQTLQQITIEKNAATIKKTRIRPGPIGCWGHPPSKLSPVGINYYIIAAQKHVIP